MRVRDRLDLGPEQVTLGGELIAVLDGAEEGTGGVSMCL